MNELGIRLEEQIISLFPDKETQICQGWILKKMGEHLFIYPLYYKFSQENLEGNIQSCEEISRLNRMDCVFRIVEHTNYYLSSILTDNGYKLKKYGVVGELHLAEADSHLYEEAAKKKKLFLKKEAVAETLEYVMEESGITIGIKRQGLLFPRATSQVAACRHLATAARVKYPAPWGVSNLMPRCLRRGF